MAFCAEHAVNAENMLNTPHAEVARQRPRQPTQTPALPCRALQARIVHDNQSEGAVHAAIGLWTKQLADLLTSFPGCTSEDAMMPAYAIVERLAPCFLSLH